MTADPGFYWGQQWGILWDRDRELVPLQVPQKVGALDGRVCQIPHRPRGRLRPLQVGPCPLQ